MVARWFAGAAVTLSALPTIACEYLRGLRIKIAYASAKANRLEHSSTKPAAINIRKPPETRSWSRMINPPLSILVRIN